VFDHNLLGGGRSLPEAVTRGCLAALDYSHSVAADLEHQ
jgi:hypothetical protein